MNRNAMHALYLDVAERLAPNMGLLTTPAAGATQGLTASPIRWQQAVEKTDCVEDVSCDCKKENISCFEKYLNLINDYYNGNIVDFMNDKEEYGKKIERLKVLINETKSRIIGYSDFIEIRELLSELGGLSDDEFNALLKKYNFDFDTLFDNIIDSNNKSKVAQIKTAEIIGSLSGSTMGIEYKFAVKYEDFITNVRKNKK